MEILPDPSSFGVVERCCRSLGKLRCYLFIHFTLDFDCLLDIYVLFGKKINIIQFGHCFKGSKH